MREPNQAARVEVPAAIVVVPADRAGRFPRHEAYAAPGWLEREPREDDAVLDGDAPTLAQLLAALELGLIDQPRTAERVAGFVTPLDAAALAATTGVGSWEILVTPGGPLTASPYAYPAVIRRAGGAAPVPRLVLRASVVPRTGRGPTWPAARLVRGGVTTALAWVLDVGQVVRCHGEDGGWAWVATDDGDHPCGWVPADLLAPLEQARDA